MIGICVLLSGVIAVVLPKDYAISIAVVFILFIAVVAGIWLLIKIQKMIFVNFSFISRLIFTIQLVYMSQTIRMAFKEMEK